jgi:hypothetical protein
MAGDERTLAQMRNEALDMLVLWAASKEYSAVRAEDRPQLNNMAPSLVSAAGSRLCPCLQEIEAVLKHWAETFGIPDTELNDRIMAAASGQLTRPCSASANVSWTGWVGGLQLLLAVLWRRLQAMTQA